MINSKNYKIFFTIFPICRDENTDKLVFIWPKFGFELFLNRPCQTEWLFDWILSIGWLTIMRKSSQHDKLCAYGK